MRGTLKFTAGFRWCRPRYLAVLAVCSLLLPLLAACGGGHHAASPTTRGPGSTGTSPASSGSTTPGGSTPTTTVKAPDIKAGPTHPNIVFVLTDDLATNLVTKQFMPHLWALMHHGVDFNNYFVTDSLCCPSRSSIFTGRYPHNTGVFTNTGPDGGYEVFERRGDESSTVATDLAAAGYRTAFLGKYLNNYDPYQDPPAPGWNAWDVAGGQGYGEYNYTLNENGKLVHYGGPGGPGDNYLTDVISRLGNTFITHTAATGKPFFMELASFAPHGPFVPNPKYAHLYPHLRYPRTPAYDAKAKNPPSWLGHRRPLSRHQEQTMVRFFRERAQDVKSVDDMIGRLETHLKAEGQWANTYFVFSSDNGLHMGEHRLLTGKETIYDTDIHVPLIVVGPKAEPGLKINAMAENVDLRSTFDQLAGTTPGEGVNGRSLVPLLAGGATPANWPQAVLVEHHGPDNNPADPDWAPPTAGNPHSYEAIRLRDAVYAEYDNGQREYYNLKTDPWELDNTYTQLSLAEKAVLHRILEHLEHCGDVSSCSNVQAPAT